MRILYGLYKADSGEIFIEGEKVTIHSPKEAIAAGVGMVTQHFTLVPPSPLPKISFWVTQTGRFITKRNRKERLYRSGEIRHPGKSRRAGEGPFSR